MRQVIFRKDGMGGYVAEVPSLPGCTAKGKNLSEIFMNTRHAIIEYYAKLEAAGQPIPESIVVDVPKADGVYNDKLLLREDVLQSIREYFPNDDTQTIMDIMDEYGKRPFEIDSERVQVASIHLSEGNVEKLKQVVSDAKRDYRDVLSWYATKFGRYP